MATNESAWKVEVGGRSVPHSAKNVIDELGQACVRAEARLVAGHHALGEMLAATTPIELSDVVARFLDIAGELARRLNWLENLPCDAAHPAGWLEPMLVRIRQHPLTEWLRSSPDPEASRLARGSAPPFVEAIAHDLPPIVLCASFLDEVATVIAHARREAT